MNASEIQRDAQRMATRQRAIQRQLFFFVYILLVMVMTYLGPRAQIMDLTFFSNYQDDETTTSRTRVLVYLTTHMSPQHIWFLKVCWPVVLQHSELLNSSDILVYATPEKSTPEYRNETYSILTNTFANPQRQQQEQHTPSLTIQIFDPLEKQEGAMAAMSKAAKYRWFDGYDWVLRLNPDVILRNDTWIRSKIYLDEDNEAQPKEEISALLINCHKTDGKFKIHTDFFAIRPKRVPRINLMRPADLKNAERSFTEAIRKSVLNKRTHRLIPGVHSPDSKCRAGRNRPWESTDILHVHPTEEQMQENECPIPFG